MWTFFQKKTEDDTETYSKKWQKEMLSRWNDIDARVTKLEFESKAYRAVARRKFVPEVTTEVENETQEPKDIYNGVLIPQ